MPNMATLLKQEITRLARKEVKAGTDVTRRATTQYRRDIAALKRQVGSLTKQVAYLEKQDKRRTTEPATASKTPRRFSANGLTTHREKLGFSAADYADLIGVSGQTIYNWEQGKSRPRAQQLEQLAVVRTLGKREALKRLDLIDH